MEIETFINDRWDDVLSEDMIDMDFDTGPIPYEFSRMARDAGRSVDEEGLHDEY
ncbi:MAG: hypothetical protein AAF074_04175 [Pseudomonadota bacterium]